MPISPKLARSLNSVPIPVKLSLSLIHTPDSIQKKNFHWYCFNLLPLILRKIAKISLQRDILIVKLYKLRTSNSIYPQSIKAFFNRPRYDFYRGSPRPCFRAYLVWMYVNKLSEGKINAYSAIPIIPKCFFYWKCSVF